MPFKPLTSEQIAQAAEDAIQSGDVAAATIERRSKSRGGDKWLDKVTDQLNEMLANPRFAFRSVEILATVFDDEPPFILTRDILKGLPGMRRSILHKNAWIKEDNWIWTIDEKGRKRVAKDEDNRYILNEGVPEGHI